MEKKNEKAMRKIDDTLVECELYTKEIIKSEVVVTREELVQRKAELEQMIIEVDAEIAEIDALG